MDLLGDLSQNTHIKRTGMFVSNFENTLRGTNPILWAWLEIVFTLKVTKSTNYWLKI